MTVSWIVVANRAGARIFEHRGAGTNPTLLREVDHPEGRLKDSDFDSDAPGRAFDRFGEGRHAYAREHMPSDQEMHTFAKELASLLEGERLRQSYAQLVLVVEPSLLGMLREELGKATDDLVVASLAKNLVHADADELATHLAPYLPVKGA